MKVTIKNLNPIRNINHDTIECEGGITLVRRMSEFRIHLIIKVRLEDQDTIIHSSPFDEQSMRDWIQLQQEAGRKESMVRDTLRDRAFAKVYNLGGFSDDDPAQEETKPAK